MERLIGSAYADTLTGNDRGNILIGGAGADTLDGERGVDTADYSTSAEAVQAYLDGTAGTGGDAAGDTLTNIENLIGSAYADTLFGNDADNVLAGGAGDDMLIGGGGADTLDGGDGTDTASYANAEAAVTAYMDGSDEGSGDAAGDIYVDIEILMGSAYADTLFGDDTDNILIGGAGADTLNGGAGTDTVTYADTETAVTAYLDGTAGTGGDAAGDTLSNIEKLIGSAYADTLFGDDAENILAGGTGDDTLIGGGAADTLDGGAGSDTASYANAEAAVTAYLDGSDEGSGDATGDIYIDIENLAGSAHADTLFGDAHDNVLTGGAGADTLDGGAGTDTASYADASSRVYIDLTAASQLFGDAHGDRLTNIENLIGSSSNDTLTGDAGGNLIDGGAGNDSLAGGAGDDTLIGGAGADTLVGGAGTDTASYAASDAAVEVRLNGSTAAGGHAQGDVLTGIENLIGSAYADTLFGDENDNVIEGGVGADRLDGGRGSDTASYAGAEAAVTAYLDGSDAGSGDAAGDIYVDIENLIGSAQADMLFGDENDNVIEGGGGADTLDGGAGSDTVSYANAGTAVTAYLDGADEATGDAAGDTLTNFENLMGSAYGDTLFGNENDNAIAGGAGDDTLTGGGGADRLDGGDGTDTADYSASAEAVQISLDGSAGTGGDAAGDTLSTIENLVGSAYADTLTGDAHDNVQIGGTGADTIDGGDGADTADYSASADAVQISLDGSAGTGGHAADDRLNNIENLTGSAHDDTLTGDDGDNILIGGDGADTLDGGDGTDTVSYASSLSSVFINLRNMQGYYGDAQDDRLTNIENVIGSDFDDYLYGNGADNVLSGGRGNDVLIGGGPRFGQNVDGGGNNILTGGEGADMFGVDRTSNPGLDRVTDFSVAEGDKLEVNTQREHETTLGEVGLTIAANSENNAHTDILFEGQLVMIVENLDYTLITDDSFFTYFVVV